MNKLDRFVLFLDNLLAQQTKKFKNTVAGLDGVARFVLKNAAELSQVADAGLGKIHKV